MALEKNKILAILTIFFISILIIVPNLTISPAYAGSSCTACSGAGCTSCRTDIDNVHQDFRQYVTDQFTNYRQWFVEQFFQEIQFRQSLALMSEQLTAVGVQQVQIIGSFFDAKHQLETQRLFQTLVAKSLKDYHPSEGICEIGTGVKSLASSERRADLAQVAFASRMMQRQLLSEQTLSGKGEISDRESRLKEFREVFCNPNDNAGGLNLLCGNGSATRSQWNMDIDYTNTVENKLTLDVDFTGTGSPAPTADEQNVFALSANIFGHQIMPVTAQALFADGENKPKDLSHFYIKQRAIAAKRSVAQNSFAAITAMRSNGDAENAPFLKAVIRELGVAPTDIENYLGANPSYFAQMEVLTKKMYQNPEFYANLYDKPVNIERKGAALQAIALMQDRDIYKSLLRSEAVLATLLETLIRKDHDRISRDLSVVKDQDEGVIN